MSLKTFTRERDGYFISSDSSLLDPAGINKAFGSEDMFWARPMSPGLLDAMIKNSFCLGVYIRPPPAPGLATPAKPTQVGFARLITDYVTFAYLTDVYVVPDQRHKGLGEWLVKCLDEIFEDMPELREMMLMTNQGKKEQHYSKTLGMETMKPGNDGAVIMLRKGPAFPRGK